jgi:hypothetical protein
MGGRQRPITETTLPWNGQTVFCRGTWDGLPVFGFRGRPGAVPAGLLTRRQLRAKGLRPGGQDPVALLVFRHAKPYRRQELCELFREELAVPVRAMTPAKWAAVEAAMQARRTCPQCQQDVGYCVPKSYGKCWNCFEDNEMPEAA